MMKKYNILFLLAILSVTLSCGDRRGPDAGKRVITVTIEPLRYFTERIAGDRFDVATMVPEGGNPETYEPSARQMVDLSRSVLYVKVGSIGFERTWMKKLEQNAPHAIVVDSSDGISLVKTENGIADPHTWMSTANARIIAGNIYRALVRIDKKDSIYFKKNLDSLVDSINRVELEVRRLTEKVSHRTFADSAGGGEPRAERATDAKCDKQGKERARQGVFCAEGVRKRKYNKCCRKYRDGDDGDRSARI